MHARLKNDFTEDEKYHNLMRWPICFQECESLLRSAEKVVLAMVSLFYSLPKSQGRVNCLPTLFKMHLLYEPHCEKTCLWGLRPIKTQNRPAQLQRLARVLKFWL